MLLLASNFALVGVAISALIAGAAIIYFRFACPACGWTRREGKPGPFRYREEVSVECTKHGYWAVRLHGFDTPLHWTRTSALEDVIRRLVDAARDKPSAARGTKRSDTTQ